MRSQNLIQYGVQQAVFPYPVLVGWLVVLRLNVPVNNFSVMSGRNPVLGPSIKFTETLLVRVCKIENVGTKNVKAGIQSNKEMYILAKKTKQNSKNH